MLWSQKDSQTYTKKKVATVDNANDFFTTCIWLYKTSTKLISIYPVNFKHKMWSFVSSNEKKPPTYCISVGKFSPELVTHKPYLKYKKQHQQQISWAHRHKPYWIFFWTRTNARLTCIQNGKIRQQSFLFFLNSNSPVTLNRVNVVTGTGKILRAREWQSSITKESFNDLSKTASEKNHHQ